MAMSQRTKIVMTPIPAKKEEDIADSIDKWLEQLRAVEEMGDQYIMQPVFKIAALKSLMIGRAKDYFETIEDKVTDFKQLLEECKEYAIRRKLDANMKKGIETMDVDNVGGEETEKWDEEEDNWWGWNWDTDNQGEIAAVGKGKSMGKGWKRWKG